jgi:hypothetical protein
MNRAGKNESCRLLPRARLHRRIGGVACAADAASSCPSQLWDIAGACEDAQMSPRAHAVDPGRLAEWCMEHLGSPPAEEIFRSGYLSAVVGLRLADGREVVVKVRPGSPRIAACVEVQRRMFQAGYPCPEPLTGAAPFGGEVATAEAYVPGGSVLPGADDAARAFAEAFARLIRLAPRPAEVPGLDPAPSWAAWSHAGDGLWPCPEDHVSLDEVAGPEWIDDAGRRARDRLRAGGSEAVIGHCDWLAGNLRWSGGELLVVHDWDSMTADSEAVLAGSLPRCIRPSARMSWPLSRKPSGSSPHTAMRVAGNSASANSNGRGRLASGPGLMTPSISTRSGSPSFHCPRMRPASACVVLGPAHRDHKRPQAAAGIAASAAAGSPQRRCLRGFAVPWVQSLRVFSAKSARISVPCTIG